MFMPIRYLRELYANPSPGSLRTFMPSVIACLLKNLSFLEVLDMEKLHDGIEHYYHNASIACSRYTILLVLHSTDATAVTAQGF